MVFYRLNHKHFLRTRTGLQVHHQEIGTISYIYMYILPSHNKTSDVSQKITALQDYKSLDVSLKKTAPPDYKLKKTKKKEL